MKIITIFEVSPIFGQVYKGIKTLPVRAGKSKKQKRSFNPFKNRTL